MTNIEPGWYKDPADPTTQRYWDGEGWLGEPLPADATPPDGPPPEPPPLPEPPPAALEGPAGSVLTQPVLVDPRSHRRAAGYAGPVPRPHGLLLAGTGVRFMARVIDILAVGLLVAVANTWLAIRFWRSFEPWWDAFWAAYLADTAVADRPAIPTAVLTNLFLMCVVACAVWFAYEVPSSANSGQTLGKRLLGIRVVRVESAEPLGFGRSLWRWGRLGLPTLLWPIVPCLPGLNCVGVGFLFQLFDCLFILVDRPLRQTLHDKSAGTVVVYVPRSGWAATQPTEPQEATRDAR